MSMLFTYTDLVGASPAPNNATDGTLSDLLTSPPPLPDTPGSSDYTAVCIYPVDEEVYEDRANLTTSGCHCNLTQVSNTCKTSI